MYQARINNKKEFRIESAKPGQKITVDGKELGLEIFREHKNILKVVKGNKNFEVLILKFNPKEKSVLLKVNGNKYEVQLKDKYDTLLEKLGMDISTQKKVNNVKAPMPGLVLNILVDEGNNVKKGDALVVLEAMKMENILKSPADGLVRKITVKKGTAVEKNQVLIEF
jgi:biotin carboxyl carrier protein